jgi:hypothetical protein
MSGGLGRKMFATINLFFLVFPPGNDSTTQLGGRVVYILVRCLGQDT